LIVDQLTNKKSENIFIIEKKQNEKKGPYKGGDHKWDDHKLAKSNKETA